MHIEMAVAYLLLTALTAEKLVILLLTIALRRNVRDRYILVK